METEETAGIRRAWQQTHRGAIIERKAAVYRDWSVYWRRKISAIAAASGGEAEGRAKETRWKKRRARRSGRRNVNPPLLLPRHESRGANGGDRWEWNDA